jgi:hypothetical protein
MVCRIAYLIREPQVEEVLEQEHIVFDSKHNKWIKWQEPFLIPQYRVSFTYDFGFCCGVDSHTETFQTRRAAEDAITSVYEGKHDWIRYDLDYMEDDDGDDN